MQERSERSLAARVGLEEPAPHRATDRARRRPHVVDRLSGRHEQSDRRAVDLTAGRAMPPRSSSLRWRTAPLLALPIGHWSGIGRAPTVCRSRAQPPKALRLYVFDCGVLNISKAGVERYHVTTAEVGETRMPVPCFLIAHPKATLMCTVERRVDRRDDGRPCAHHLHRRSTPGLF